MAGVFLDAGGAALPALRQALGELLGEIAHIEIGARRGDAGQIRRQRARRRRDRHVVVVEDDDEALVARAGVVHRLVGHAGRHRAVADHRDDVVLGAREIAGDGHAEAGGDRGRGMPDAEGVVLALGALVEAGEAAAGAQRADAIATAGQDLVRIALVADVPDQPVARSVEHPVQGDRQLDDAEAGAEMPAGHRHRIDGLRSQFVGELAQLALGQPPQILGRIHPVEKRRLGCRRNARSVHTMSSPDLLSQHHSPAAGLEPPAQSCSHGATARSIARSPHGRQPVVRPKQYRRARPARKEGLRSGVPGLLQRCDIVAAAADGP